MDQAYRQLRDHGLSVAEPVIQGYGMKQLYVTDPDGYTLCFQWHATEQARAEWQARYGSGAAA